MLIPDELYGVVKQSMPIPCVDVMAADRHGRVLMVKRLNPPARGQWWFPGGRVHFLEPRPSAALRKLREECNLEAIALIELGSHDVIFHGANGDPPSHAITTLFAAHIEHPGHLKLDGQSEAAEWRAPQAWVAEPLHPFVVNSLMAQGWPDRLPFKT